VDDSNSANKFVNPCPAALYNIKINKTSENHTIYDIHVQHYVYKYSSVCCFFVFLPQK